MKKTTFSRIPLLFVSMALVFGCYAMLHTFAVDRQEKRQKKEVQSAAAHKSDSEELPYESIFWECCEKADMEVGSPLTANITKAASSGTIDNVYVLKNSARFKSTGAGAHYYVYSDYSNTYSEAYTNVQLPTGFENNNGSRNGYVSLGITGSAHGIDIGISNTGSGWFPYTYDVGYTFTTFTDYTAPSTATNAIIMVKPVDTTTVHMYVQFLDASGNHVGLTFDRDIPVASGNLVSKNNKMMCRFYRFASLVPVGTDNQSDGTYMTGGQFTECQLYNGSNYVNWGIDSNLVTNAWIISSTKISVDYATYNDTFSIYHS